MSHVFFVHSNTVDAPVVQLLWDAMRLAGHNPDRAILTTEPDLPENTAIVTTTLAPVPGQLRVVVVRRDNGRLTPEASAFADRAKPTVLVVAPEALDVLTSLLRDLSMGQSA